MRQIKKINKGWCLVNNEGMPKTVISVNADKEKFPQVCSLDEEKTSGKKCSGNVCLFYKIFKLEDVPEGELLFLEIGSINSRCRVYLNDELLSERCRVYSPFRVELSGRIVEENALLIAVDNQKTLHASLPFTDYIDISGMLGDINLIGVPRSHFSLLKSDNPAIRVTNGVDDIEINIEVFVTNSSEEMLKYIIYDNEGRVVAQKTTSVDNTRVKLRVENHEEHFNENSMYLCEVELLGEDMVLDKVGTRVYLGNALADSRRRPLGRCNLV